MTGRQNLYFIAIVPPEKICREITGFKDDFATRFKSRAALKLIPHITLKAPFKSPAAHHADTIQWFEQMRVTVSYFQQELEGFGAFHNRHKHVIYVKPIMNLPLQNLQKELLQNFRIAYPGEIVTNPEIDFKPHITIAYRDLQSQLFKEAWKEYQSKKYEARFDVKRFQLLQHNGRIWNTVSTFSLQ